MISTGWITIFIYENENNLIFFQPNKEDEDWGFDDEFEKDGLPTIRKILF